MCHRKGADDNGHMAEEPRAWKARTRGSEAEVDGVIRPSTVTGRSCCRLSNNFSRLTYKFSRVFEPLKAENRPVPTHIFSVQQAAPFSHNQGCANSPFHNETKIYESGHNTIRKAHLHDDMKNYGSETETMCPFSGKPLDTTTVIMLHRKIMWQDHKSHMVLTH